MPEELLDIFGMLIVLIIVAVMMIKFDKDDTDV